VCVVIKGEKVILHIATDKKVNTFLERDFQINSKDPPSPSSHIVVTLPGGMTICCAPIPVLFWLKQTSVYTRSNWAKHMKELHAISQRMTNNQVEIDRK
jgi:hypothetical protein